MSESLRWVKRKNPRWIIDPAGVLMRVLRLFSVSLAHMTIGYYRTRSILRASWKPSVMKR